MLFWHFWVMKCFQTFYYILDNIFNIFLTQNSRDVSLFANINIICETIIVAYGFNRCDESYFRRLLYMQQIYISFLR